MSGLRPLISNYLNASCSNFIGAAFDGKDILFQVEA